MILEDGSFYLWEYNARLENRGFEGWLLYDLVNTQRAFEKKISKAMILKKIESWPADCLVKNSKSFILI